MHRLLMLLVVYLTLIDWLHIAGQFISQRIAVEKDWVLPEHHSAAGANAARLNFGLGLP